MQLPTFAHSALIANTNKHLILCRRKKKTIFCHMPASQFFINGGFRHFMAYTLEFYSNNIIKKLPKTSCVMVPAAVDIGRLTICLSISVGENQLLQLYLFMF